MAQERVSSLWWMCVRGGWVQTPINRRLRPFALHTRAVVRRRFSLQWTVFYLLADKTATRHFYIHCHRFCHDALSN